MSPVHFNPITMYTIFTLNLLFSEIPKIEQLPVDTTAKEGESAIFRCAANGDGDVKLTWDKAEGTPNKHKWTILANNTLRIDNVDASDKGSYVCRAENDAGSSEAVARLTVDCKGKVVWLKLFSWILLNNYAAKKYKTSSLPQQLKVDNMYLYII